MPTTRLPSSFAAARAPRKSAASSAAPAPSDTAPRWTGTRAPIDLRRENILRSVGYVMRDTRLSSLTMQSIANALGITKGNLYYYFEDKQDILFQCRMRCMEISLAALDDALKEAARRGADHAAVLRTLLERHLLGILEDGMGNVLLSDLDDLDPPRREHYVAERDRFEAGVRQLITAGVKRGVFSCASSKLAGFTILGAINWVPKWYKPDGAWSAEDIARQMSDMLVQSLRSQPGDAPPCS